MVYYDKHGKQIKPGMIISNGAGLTAAVEDMLDGTLAVMATNENFRRRHPNTTCDEFYPLTPAATKEYWEVIE